MKPIFLSALLACSLISCISFQWGNHFDITCDFNFPVDSIAMTICATETVFLYPGKDTLENLSEVTVFEGNVGTPEEGYPCPVKFKLFSGDKFYAVAGVPFDCNHCDVNHHYFLGRDTVSYTVTP